MKKSKQNSFYWIKNPIRVIAVVVLLIGTSHRSAAQVKLEKEFKITDTGLYFDGKEVGSNATNNGTQKYDFFYGRKISAHGDCIKKYKHYIFMTWYRGGKFNRHVMLTRYNTKTGKQKTIEFPHKHTGFQNKWWIGESHNTIAVGISKDGVIHLLYDMHSYSKDRPSGGAFKNDYFRYSFSKKNAATVSDTDFNLSQFKKDRDGDYKHLSLNGKTNYNEFSKLTYPHFFLNGQGDLFMWIRTGGNSDGAYKFTKYNSNTSQWSGFTQFNTLNAKRKGEAYNWGLYGTIKFEDDKMRIGFQRRLGNKNDKYMYQNGFYYAYSDHVDGKNQWKNHKGESFSLPLIKADKVKVFEPGNLVAAQGKDQVRMVEDFDWAVTDRGDVHIIGKVRDMVNKKIKYVHTYKKNGSNNFTTTTNFSGASKLYTSGPNVYIIGLNSNGRVYIEKAKGGTNSFVKVYEAKNGKRFRHGKVYINDGKLYYYLMERGSGDKQPIHLQIIDLDLNLNPSNKKPSVDFIVPTEDNTVNEGYKLQVRAKASDSDGSIKKVALFINDKLVRTDGSSPYEWGHTGSPNPNELNGLKAGKYTFKAVATDNKGAKSMDSFTLTVKRKENPDPDPSNCSFGTPRTSALPSIARTSYTKVYVLGENGPDMRNIRKFSINWKASANGLYQFAFNTKNGNPDYYIDLRGKVTHNFRSSKPSVKIVGSGIGVDGDYWVTKDGVNFIMVSKKRGFTLYFSNINVKPSCKNKSNDNLLNDDSVAFVEVNPVTSELLISNMPKDAYNVVIYDYTGKEILSKNIAEGEKANSQQMDVTWLSSGLYFVKIKAEGKDQELKFLKE